MSGSDRGDGRKTLETFAYVSFAVFVGALYIWMFYDMGASAARYRVEQEQASQAYTESASNEARTECAGRESPATCEREIEQADREGQRNEKDLEAQRSMADWAFWLLVISAFQFPATLAALVFVKRTLDATLEAVRDTGKATKAMERQNRLVESAQRPWVKISVEAESILYNEHQIYIKSRTSFANIGTTAARNLHIRMRVGFYPDDWDKTIMPQFENWKNWIVETDNVLLPGESITIDSNFGSKPSEIAWSKQGILGNFTHGLIISGAFYTADGDDKPFWTLRAYVVTHHPKSDGFRPMGIKEGQYGRFSDDEIHLNITRDQTR